MGEAPSPVITALIAGLAALGGALGGPFVTGYFNLGVTARKASADYSLAEQKFYSELIMKAIEPKDKSEKIDMLDLLSKTHIIADAKLRESIDSYVSAARDNKVSIPSPRALSDSPSSAPRLYLLAGSSQKASSLDALRQSLITRSFNVIGSKQLIDSGRPDQPEIRFFNANKDDEEQSKQLVSVVLPLASGGQVSVKGYFDASAKPGYIEIWLGR